MARQFKKKPRGLLVLNSFCYCIKVTVQFETEGNGQNEIVSHMDRSEVKL